MRLTTTVRTGRLACGVILIAAMACGGKDDGKSIGTAANFTDACEQTGEVLCERLFDCIHDLYTLVYGSVSTCKTMYVLACNRSVQIPGQGLTTTYFSTCANVYQSTSCSDLLDAASGVGIDGCQGQPGSYPNGASCTQPIQCQSLYCKNANVESKTCGTCSARVPEGASCDGIEMCEPGLQCVAAAAASSTRICAKGQPLGATCDASHPCVGRTSCVAGICSRMGGPGEACGTGAADRRCDATQAVTCNSLTGQCEPMKSAQIGEACGLIGGGQILCARGSVCVTNGADASRTCVAVAATGHACSNTDGPYCESMYDYCIDGLCSAPDYSLCQ